LAACGGIWLEEPPAAPYTPGCPSDQVLDLEQGRCVPRGCSSDVACPEAERCDPILAVCVPREPKPEPEPPVCAEPERSCDEGRLAICLAGQWRLEACEGEGFCHAGRCVACTPGDRRCHPERADAYQVCSYDGGEWLLNACADPEATCQDARCLLCEPGASRCDHEGSRLRCDPFGQAWLPLECPPETVCVEEAGEASCQLP
jgi:hypothetical protein